MKLTDSLLDFNRKVEDAHAAVRCVARARMRWCAHEYRRTLTAPEYDGRWNDRIELAVDWLVAAATWREAAK